MAKNFFKEADAIIDAAIDMGMGEQLLAIDNQFRSYLSGITYRRDIGGKNLETYSPLDSVASFSFYGIQNVEEVDTNAMLDNCDGIKKLLANMLAQCQPGALSEDDVRQLSGINGREMNA